MFSPLSRLIDRLSLRSRPRRLPAGRRDRHTPLILEVLESRLSPATDIWTGAAAPDTSWTNGQNWASATAPNPGDSLSFPANAVSTTSNNNYTPGTTFGPITISGSGYDITGNSVTLQGGLSATNSKGTNTVALPLTLGANESVTSTNAGTDLVLTGAINNGGNTLTVGGAGDVLYSGNSISGSGGLALSGSGQLTLADSSPNTYTGTTNVNSGTLLLDGAQGGAVPGKLVVGDGAGGSNADVARLAAPNQTNPGSPLTVNSSGLFDLNGFNDTVGPLTLTAGHVTTGAGTLTLTGGVTTNAASSASSIAGNLSLGSGSSPQTFNVANGSAGTDLNVSANISGGSGVELLKEGGGNLNLSGNNSYAGPTHVSAGTLTASSANALGSGSAGTTVGSGGTLAFHNPTADSSLTFAAEPVTINGGIVTGTGSSATEVVPGKITLGADSTVSAASGDTLNLTGVVSGPGGLTTTGDGQVKLGNANTYTGATVVNEGALILDNAQALGGSPGTTVTGTGTLMLEKNLTYAPEPLTLQSLGDSAGDAALHSQDNTTWTGPIYLASSSNISTDPGGTLTVSGKISGPATSNLDIGRAGNATDYGTVLFTNANTYAGSTTVNYGTLAIANSHALGATDNSSKTTTVDAGASLQLQGGVSFDAGYSLALNGSGYGGGGALQNGSGNNTWGGAINLASSAALGASSGTTLTVNGVISGPSASTLSSVGSGTVALAAADNYLGATRVRSGTLALQNPSALGAGTAGTSVSSGATLQLAGGLTYNPEPLTLNGAGVGGTAGALQSLTGNNTWQGGITLGSAATVKSESGSTLNVTGTVANEGYLLTANTLGNTNFANTISGAGGLAKNGPGTLTFSGTSPNLYAGTTTVNAGTLSLAKSAGIAAVSGSGVVVNASGTLAGAGTINTNVTNSGTVSPGGTGTIGALAINGNYTQTSGGILSMEVASPSALDQLMISGMASLGGTLNVGLLGGFLPSSGDQYKLLTFGSSSGTFGTVNLPSPGNGVVLTTTYNPQDVTIAAS